MTQNITDKIEEISRDTYANYLDEYYDIHGDPVHEDDEKIVFADKVGHELGELANEIGVERSQVAEWMHEKADDVDYNWVASDPVVLLKE